MRKRNIFVKIENKKLVLVQLKGEYALQGGQHARNFHYRFLL